MKLIAISLLISLSAHSQRTGISYQALIIKPDGEQLPGFNNQNAPLVNTAICLEFIIIDHNNSIEYSEYQSITTDKYGMVNLTIGTGNFAGGSSGGWDNIIWSENSKRLKVRLDVSGTCSGFVEISDQELTSVPFALFAPGQEGRDGDSVIDAAVLALGADDDVTLTHVADTGLLLNSSRKIQFGDSGTFIHQSSDGVLTITSDTTVDINGAVVMDGALSGLTSINVGGTITGDTSLTLDSTTITTAEIGVLDAVTAGTAAASKALVLDSNKDIGTIRNLTIDGVFTDGNYTFDTSGNVSGLGTVGCGAITTSGDLTVNADTSTFASANTTDPVVIIKNTTNDANGARLKFVKDKGAAGADNDVAGLIEFYADDDNQDQVKFAEIKAQVADASNGAEGGKLSLSVAEHDGTSTAGLI